MAFSEEQTYESAGGREVYSTGFILNKEWSKDVTFGSVQLKALALPRNFDWRSITPLSPVRDQKKCGACWSFSTVATLQDAVAIKDKKIVDFSEQFLLSCNKKGWSCNGGFFAHDYHMSPYGGVDDAQFPYVAQDVACKSGLTYKNRLLSWAYLPSANEDTPPSDQSIKEAIYQYGPVSVGVAVDKNFQDYRSGVFNNCTANTPNHAVNLVGWNDDGQYWIMRNSWASTWGEQGFMKIRYGCNKIGIAANYVVYKDGGSIPNPPPDPKPDPGCSPKAVANAGPNINARRFQTVRVGTPGIPGTAYHWETSVRQGTISVSPQIYVLAMMPQKLTVYATTKCGTAKSTMVLNVR
jgi:hypothetical protein